MSASQELLFVVAARPMLSPAVMSPRPNMAFRTILVRRRICRPQRRDSGMSAVAMSMMQANTDGLELAQAIPTVGSAPIYLH